MVDQFVFLITTQKLEKLVESFQVEALHEKVDVAELEDILLDLESTLLGIVELTKVVSGPEGSRRHVLLVLVV